MDKKITVKEIGSLEDGGWSHLEDKKLDDEGVISILLMWNEAMDKNGLGIYIGKHLKATGEFPDSNEIPTCAGCVQIYSADPQERNIDFEFSDYREMVEAVNNARLIMQNTSTWRGWIKTVNLHNSTWGLATLRSRLSRGVITKEELFRLALQDKWTVGEYNDAARVLGFRPWI